MVLAAAESGNYGQYQLCNVAEVSRFPDLPMKELAHHRHCDENTQHSLTPLPTALHAFKVASMVEVLL
jgi:hypothetical protein